MTNEKKDVLQLCLSICLCSDSSHIDEHKQVPALFLSIFLFKQQAFRIFSSQICS